MDIVCVHVVCTLCVGPTFVDHNGVAKIFDSNSFTVLAAHVCGVVKFGRGEPAVVSIDGVKVVCFFQNV